MYRKVISLFIVIVFILSMTVIAEASSFVLRNGITWYMTKEKVLSMLKTEDSFDSYIISDENDDEIKQVLYKMSSNERTNPKIWGLRVDNVSLGKTNEDVVMYLFGTKPYGLHDVFYYIIPNSKNDEVYYNRAIEIETQLSKKYGEFKKENNWNKRNSIKSGELAYKSWKRLDDDTGILLTIQKKDSGYYLSIEYQSPRLKEIETSISDGSIYIEPAFGL